MKTKELIIALLILVLLFALVVSFDANADGCGYIEIPSINAKFDLSFFAKDANAHQHIAMLYKAQGCQRIGNHYASSATWKLENVRLGDKAYLDYVTMDGLEEVHHGGKYACYAVMICDVNGNTLSRNGQELVFAKTDLVCVTCVGSDSTRNYVAVFEKIS